VGRRRLRATGARARAKFDREGPLGARPRRPDGGGRSARCGVHVQPVEDRATPHVARARARRAPGLRVTVADRDDAELHAQLARGTCAALGRRHAGDARRAPRRRADHRLRDPLGAHRGRGARHPDGAGDTEHLDAADAGDPAARPRSSARAGTVRAPPRRAHPRGDEAAVRQGPARVQRRASEARAYAAVVDVRPVAPRGPTPRPQHAGVRFHVRRDARERPLRRRAARRPAVGRAGPRPLTTTTRDR